jgi:hypothetical protein
MNACTHGQQLFEWIAHDLERSVDVPATRSTEKFQLLCHVEYQMFFLTNYYVCTEKVIR